MKLYKLSKKNKVAFSTLFFFIMFSACTNKDVNISPIQQIKLIVNYPMMKGSKLINLPDTLSIYYYENQIIYNIPHISTFQINDQLIREEITYNYFLYQQGAMHGFLFKNSDDTTQPDKLPVDSFLFSRAYASKFDFDFSKLISRGQTIREDHLLEKYTPKGIPNENRYDSLYLYYNAKLNHLPYSFSQAVDSLKGRKLYKIRILFNRRFLPGSKMTIPKREFLFEIKEVPLRNPIKVRKIIDSLKLEIAAIYNNLDTTVR